MKNKYYLFTAVISYLVLLTASIPAKPVTDYINDNTTVFIKGVSGSLWTGNATLIDINGLAELEDTSWSFNLWKLFLGQLAIELDSHYLEKELSTEASLSVFGTLYLNNLSASIEAEQIVKLANLPLVQLDGLLSLQIESAQFEKGELPLAIGTINWNQASISVAESASLGNVSIILSESEQQATIAIISNKGGDILVSGTAELIPPENYAVDMKFSPTATAKNSIRQSLGMFAKKQNNGDFLLKNSGSIKQIDLL